MRNIQHILGVLVLQWLFYHSGSWKNLSEVLPSSPQSSPWFGFVVLTLCGTISWYLMFAVLCFGQLMLYGLTRFSWPCSRDRKTLLKRISKVCCSWGNYLAPALLSGADQQIPQIVGSTPGKPVRFPWGLWCSSTHLWQKCKSQTQNLCIPFVFTPLWASAVAQKINMWWPRHSSGHELGHWGPQL